MKISDILGENRLFAFLLFLLFFSLFFHSFASINQDIGRHLKLGEIIWSEKSVPKTNLFSYTQPDFPFVNHHWLSEVIFYSVYRLTCFGGDLSFCESGLKGLILFKAVVLLAAFWLLFKAVKGKNILSLFVSFIFFVFIFMERTEPRPEVFSYLFLALYLYILFENKYKQKHYLLWFLPIVQFFWVNAHIYFIIGPIIYSIFLIDSFFSGRINKKQVLIFLLIAAANLLNPNFFKGAVYPLAVFNNYGYDIVENKSIFFLAKYFNSWTLSDKFFLASLPVLFSGFISNFRRLKNYVFEFLLIIFLAILALKMKRNVQLYAFGLFPVLVLFLNGWLEKLWNKIKKPARIVLLANLALILVIYLAASNRIFVYIDSSKKFGLGIPQSAQAATDFLKENRISGNVFNNFDIGSYLIWQLYPGQKVFVDGRPEAYPADFFTKIYKPMQSDPEVWKQLSREYGINYVFFSHTDITPWASEFINNMKKNKDWPIVFLNDSIIVFMNKNGKSENKSIISKHELTPEKFKGNIEEVLQSFDKNNDASFRTLGIILYRLGWYENSAVAYDALIEAQKNNPYGYQGAGYAYSAVNNIENQSKAVQRFEKAIELGLENSFNLFVLGVAYANLGDFEKAKQAIRKSLEFEPSNAQAVKILQYIESR